MSNINDVVDRFVAWYSGERTDPELREHILRNVSVDCGAPRIDAEVLVWAVEEAARPTVMTVIDRVDASAGAALLFEYVDPVTELRMRTAIFVAIEEGRITRVRSISMAVQ